MERVEAIVSGHVQGVSYRYFVVACAEARALTGTVRNLPEGTVAVVAEGAPEELAAFLKELEDGPEHAKVAQVESTRQPTTGAFTDFSIAYGT